MSSPILPAEGLPGLPSTPTSSTPADDEVGVIAATGTPCVQAARGGPPPDLLEEMLAVDHLAQQLRERGYQVRFFPAVRGATRIELHDAEESVVSLLTVAQAMGLASAHAAE